MDPPGIDDDTARALGRGWTTDEPWRLLTRLTELPDRLGGHPGERRGAELVAESLADAGVRDIEERTFEMARWSRGGAELAVSVPERGVERAVETVALPYSPPVDLQAPLVDVGYGTPGALDDADVSGAVALTRTGSPPEFDRPYHRAEKVGHAAAAGVDAFVFVNHVPGQLPPTGSLRFGREAAIPGLGVSRETGAWLREYADADTGARARVRVDADTTPGTSRNVVGTLGPDTDEAVLVLAHVDSHDVGEGALDNGAGVATVAGMAAVLAGMDLDRRVRVAAVGAEELGLLGSHALARETDPDDVHAVVNVDGAGRYRDLAALVHASDALADLVEAVADDLGHPVEVRERPHPYSDHWPFLQDGVPSLQLHSRNPDADGPWDRGWAHTRADTREKVDERTLRSHALVGALLVRAVAAADLPRVGPDRVRERLEAIGTDEGMRAADIWPDDWE